jgi:hypothetical protein
VDENIRVLESALEDDGFKVVMPRPESKNEALRRQGQGWAILRNNSQDFIDEAVPYEAVRYDYDVIGIEDIKFVDGRPDRTNEIVGKISKAVRRGQLATRKGIFWLKIRDNGSFHLEPLLSKTVSDSF